MQFAKKGLYRTYWQWRAAKDLEAAVQINPREFYAWHNYGDVNSNAGDLGMMNDYSNARARGDRVHPRDRAQSQVGAPRTRPDRRI
jgi:hypothetical protein